MSMTVSPQPQTTTNTDRDTNRDTNSDRDTITSTDTSAWAIDASNLRKVYRRRGQSDFVAVDELSLQVRQGERFGFLGPNGAGKTTTISMLASLIEPTSGSAKLAGFDLRKQRRQVKQHIGLVPQELALYPTLSARANLRYFASIYGLRGATRDQRINDALELVSLQARADEPVQNFSGGMKRRVNIAAGLLHKPQILFLDEPTVGVDPQSRNFIFDNVEALNAQGMTVIYTSHYMEEVERLCERVAIIDEGKLIALGSPQELVAEHGGGLLLLRLPQPLPEDIVQHFTHHADVQTFNHHADGDMYNVQVRSHTPYRLLAELVSNLNSRALAISTLELQQANLESVFLALTGKRLRE